MPSEYTSECLYHAAVYGLTGPRVFAPLVRWVFVPGNGSAFHNGRFGQWVKELDNG